MSEVFKAPDLSEGETGETPVDNETIGDIEKKEVIKDSPDNEDGEAVRNDEIDETRLTEIEREDAEKVEGAREKIRNIPVDGEEVQTASSEDVDEVGAEASQKEKGTAEEQEEGVTRREFIKRTGAAAVGVMAGGAMSGFVNPPEAKAGLEEVLEFDDVKKGSHDEMVKELYDEVFEKDKEMARFHFKATEKFKTKEFFKGKTDEGWFDGEGIEHAESSVIIAPENFEVLMEDPSKLEKMSFFHTHPAAAIENIREQMEKEDSAKDILFGDHEEEQQKQDRMTLAMSEADLNGFMNVCIEYPKGADKFSMEILEPTGHWKIEMNSEKETAENFKRMQEEYKQEVDKFNKLEEEEKNEYRKKATLVFIEENRESSFSELRRISSDKNAIFTTFRKNEEYFSQLKNLSSVGDEMVSCKTDDEREEIAQKAIETAKSLGLSMEYTQMHPHTKKERPNGRRKEEHEGR